MKKFFTLILMIMFLCACSSPNQKIDTFDPDKFETTATQISQENPKSPYNTALQNAFNELKDKISRGDMTLNDTETEKKVSAFIKTIPKKDWNKYSSMKKVTEFTLISKLPNILPKEEALKCFDEIKKAHLQLIDNDPNFSPKFKSAIKEKMEKLYLLIPGVTHLVDDIAEFHIDELKLNDKGELENLKEWNNFHEFELTWLYPEGTKNDTKNLNTLFSCENTLNGFENLQQHASVKNLLATKTTQNETNTNTNASFQKYALMSLLTERMIVSPALIFNDTPESSDYNYIKNLLLFVLGHETSHFILKHFNANNKSICIQYLFDGDKTTYKTLCEKNGREYHEGDELNHELVKSLREQNIEAEYKLQKNNYKDNLAITTETDQTYIDDLYKNFVTYVDHIDTNLVFPESFDSKLIPTGKYDSLKGKPVKLSGEIYFGECIADIFGTKAAKIAAEKLSIPQTPNNNIYANSSIELFCLPPLDAQRVLFDPHPIWPYRFRWMYKFSHIDPDIWGFKDHLAGI